MERLMTADGLRGGVCGAKIRTTKPDRAAARPRIWSNDSPARSDRTVVVI
jgi:hypothetical protein